MDSTPAPTPVTNPKASAATKLPIKRKIAADPSHLQPLFPDPYPYPDPTSILNLDPSNFPPIPSFKTPTDSDTNVTAIGGGDPRPPPFKFHRIWTEPDEIRFLQDLLSCRSENLSFPRDLNVFYARFSNMMSQPYTKSQLSEKLRRLRKKYRVISTRLAKGLDQSFLSPHDRALYELSNRLWHPDHAETSPFGGGGDGKMQKSDLVGVKVNFLPTFPSDSDPNLVANFELNFENNENDNHVDGFLDVGFDGEVKLSEVNVKFEEEGKMVGRVGEENGVGEVASKAIIDVFDESLKEVRMGFLSGGLSLGGCVKERESRWNFERRWQEQRVAELEALGRRVKLVFEHSRILQRQ